VVVEQKFHNTFNELQHKSVLYQWLNILLSQVEVLVVLRMVVVAVLVVCVSVLFL
jgi:hypothetical protein